MDRPPLTRVKPTTSKSLKTKAIKARAIKNMLSTLTRSQVLKQKITKADQHHRPPHTFTAITTHDYDFTATSPQKRVEHWTMSTLVSIGFTDLPQEIRPQIYALSARMERDNQLVLAPMWTTERARYMISALVLRVADLTCVHRTPHNLEVFKDICVHRKSLMETCTLSRQVKLKMRINEVQNAEEGEIFYGCLWLADDR